MKLFSLLEKKKLSWTHMVYLHYNCTPFHMQKNLTPNPESGELTSPYSLLQPLSQDLCTYQNYSSVWIQKDIDTPNI